MTRVTESRRASILFRLRAPLGVSLAAGLVCAAVWWGDPTKPGGPFLVCPAKMLFGVDCPGCGSLRMLYSVLHGDLLAAVKFNALALAALVLLIWAYAVWTYGRIAGRRIVSWPNHRWAPAVTLVLVSAWLVLRNIPFGPFTALRV